MFTMKTLKSLFMKVSLLIAYFIAFISTIHRMLYKNALPHKMKIVLLIKVILITVAILLLIRAMWERQPVERNQSLRFTISNNITPSINSQYDSYSWRDPTEPKKLRIVIKNHNLFSRVRNWKRFKLLKENSVMIVVQVHRDVTGLHNLITSLMKTRHIEEVLLVFSHSYYSNIMNTIVRSIKKCGVLQLYYPYSVQLHKNKFPGRDKDDCVSDLNKECSSRNAYYAELKHHWWWTANYVFEKFDITSYFKGPVLFLEENHYVAPDLIYMLRFMRRALYYFPTAELMAFGRPDSGVHSNFDTLYLEAWRPPFTLGLAFNRTLWQRIAEKAIYFCTFDDYDWSYSLYNVMHNFHQGYAEMVTCAAQRVFSTKEGLQAAQLRLNRTLEYLFPNKVKMVHLWGVNGAATPAIMSPDALRGRGGWKDTRDQMFCLDIMAPDTTTTESKDETTTITRTSKPY